MARRFPPIPRRQRRAPMTTTTKTAAKNPRGASQLSTKTTMILRGASATAREGSYRARSIVLSRSVAEYPPPCGVVRQATTRGSIRGQSVRPPGAGAIRNPRRMASSAIPSDSRGSSCFSWAIATGGGIGLRSSKQHTYPNALQNASGLAISKVGSFVNYLRFKIFMDNSERGGSLKNIHVHYDLSNDLFRTFLDKETLMYSSAIYDAVAAPPAIKGSPSSGLLFRGSLEEAQWRKLDTLCDRAQIMPVSLVRKMGFNDVFLRVWNYYMTYCEAGFRSQTEHCLILVFSRPGNRALIPLSESRSVTWSSGPSFTDFIGVFRTTNATKATLKIVPYLHSCKTLQ
jgi:hypothetical protein